MSDDCSQSGPSADKNLFFLMFESVRPINASVLLARIHRNYGFLLIDQAMQINNFLSLIIIIVPLDVFTRSVRP